MATDWEGRRQEPEGKRQKWRWQGGGHKERTRRQQQRGSSGSSSGSGNRKPCTALTETPMRGSADWVQLSWNQRMKASCSFALFLAASRGMSMQCDEPSGPCV